MTLYNNKKSEINKKIKKITSMKLRKNLINIEEEFSEKEKNILFEQGRLIEELYNDYLELDNIYYDAYYKTINFISRKLRSLKEVDEYLTKQKVNDENKNKIIKIYLNIMIRNIKKLLLRRKIIIQ